MQTWIVEERRVDGADCGVDSAFCEGETPRNSRRYVGSEMDEVMAS